MSQLIDTFTILSEANASAEILVDICSQSHNLLVYFLHELLKVRDLITCDIVERLHQFEDTSILQLLCMSLLTVSVEEKYLCKDRKTNYNP
jgi:hypothetical protein